jgi:hypothetical protein
MFTAKKQTLTTEFLLKTGNSRSVTSLNKNGISEEFCEAFHEASMSAMQEINKGKKPKFVKVA